MKGRSHNNMDSNRGNLHVSMFIIGLTESPEIIIFTRPFTITRIPKNSSIISDRVFFIFINTLYLLLKIINITHINRQNNFNTRKFYALAITPNLIILVSHKNASVRLSNFNCSLEAAAFDNPG